MKKTKKTGNKINKVIHKNQNKDSLTCIKTAKGIETESKKIGSNFNNFFTTVAETLVSEINTTKNFNEYLDPKQVDSLFLAPISKKEMESCIKTLDSKRSSDIYGMSKKLLKILSAAISDILYNIFNESFKQEVFLNHIKMAMVTSIYKGGSKLYVCNYRPVSVLPIFSKIMEKPMLRKLVDFLGKKLLFLNIILGFKKITQQH